jgi:hypothetical protein
MGYVVHYAAFGRLRVSGNIVRELTQIDRHPVVKRDTP